MEAKTGKSHCHFGSFVMFGMSQASLLIWDGTTPAAVLS